MLSGNGPTLGVEGERVRATRRTGAAIGGHHQRGVARVFAGVRGKHLVERNAVVIIAISAGIRRSDKLIGIRMAMHPAQRGIRQARKYSQLIA